MAAPPRQAPAGEEYTVQAGDWLTKISEKYFGRAMDYPAIIEATNAKAAEDNAFSTINDPNVIVVGQKLWIPAAQAAAALTVGDIAFNSAAVENLGIQTVVPQNWPEVESNDPFLAHTWSAGLFSRASFTSVPGNDTQAGLARLLGVSKEDLNGVSLGGRLVEARVGDRPWTLYIQDKGGVTSVGAATVQDKTIYLVSLFAETSQMEAILGAILENFEITNAGLTQQSITIETPRGGMTLTNPFELRGTTSQYPFNGSLVYRVQDAGGNQVGRGIFEVVGTIGNPATFAIPANYQVTADGPGTVEVAEISAADGTIIAIDSVGVMLSADSDGYPIIIDDPKPFASVSNPVQIRGKTGDRPFEGRLNYRIVDATGEEISSGLFESRGEIGQVNSFDGFAEFDVLADGPGRIEVYNIRPADGSVFSIGTVNVWLTTTP
jgi:hypothetical protein